MPIIPEFLYNIRHQNDGKATTPMATTPTTSKFSVNNSGNVGRFDVYENGQLKHHVNVAVSNETGGGEGDTGRHTNMDIYKSGQHVGTDVYKSTTEEPWSEEDYPIVPDKREAPDEDYFRYFNLF